MKPEKTLEWTLPSPFQSAEGGLWLANLPLDMHPLTDTNGHTERSRLRLFEDAREVGPGHSLHDSIISQGKGRYSFWKDTLYFSTSDGSDPNVNGRLYRVVLQEAEAVASLDLAIEMPVREWASPRRPLRCAVLGMGNRGLHLARMAQGYAGVEIAWVVDVSYQPSEPMTLM